MRASWASPTCLWRLVSVSCRLGGPVTLRSRRSPTDPTAMTAAADRTILVTGGSGFVCPHLAARLVAGGFRVVVPTRRRAAAEHLLLIPTVDVVEADIHDAATFTRLARGA